MVNELHAFALAANDKIESLPGIANQAEAVGTIPGIVGVVRALPFVNEKQRGFSEQMQRGFGFQGDQFCLMARDEAGVYLPRNEVRIFQRADEERIVGAQAGDLRLLQSMRELRR